jgi:hypothetical protein
MRNLLKKQGFAPNLLLTDKLRSYGTAKRQLRLSVRREQGLQALRQDRIEILDVFRKTRSVPSGA